MKMVEGGDENADGRGVRPGYHDVPPFFKNSLQKKNHIVVNRYYESKDFEYSG